MVRIVVTTFGSTGDLNPFIALELALSAIGHDVLSEDELQLPFAPSLNPSKLERCFVSITEVDLHPGGTLNLIISW